LIRFCGSPLYAGRIQPIDVKTAQATRPAIRKYRISFSSVKPDRNNLVPARVAVSFCQNYNDFKLLDDRESNRVVIS